MKKLLVFVFCGVMAINCLFAITPMELKEGRMMVYDWLLNYNNNMDFRNSRNAKQTFLNLFSDQNLNIYNDYYPQDNYDYGNPYISVAEYADMRMGAKYRTLESNLSEIQLNSERLSSNNKIEYTITFVKTISYEYRKHDSYCYPPISKKIKVTLEYDFKEHHIAAIQYDLADSNEKMAPFYILHDSLDQENQNIILLEEELETLQQQSNYIPLIKQSFKHLSFDDKMLCEVSDTIKNSIGFKLGAGLGQYNFKSKGFYNTSKINYDASIGFNYYRQLYLKSQNRLGIVVGLQYKWLKYNIHSDYRDAYNSVDPDGGQYLRKISVTNLKENIQRHSLGVPLYLRYDYFINKSMSVFGNFGIDCQVDLAHHSKLSGDVVYSGYYDWLYGVEMDQNDIYDFGSFQFDKEINNINLYNVNIGILAEIGWSYYIQPNFSLDLSLSYNPIIYNSNISKDFHLTKYNGDLRSSYSSFNRLNSHLININIQFNYNF